MFKHSLVLFVLLIITFLPGLFGLSFSVARDYVDLRLSGYSHAESMFDLTDYVDNLARYIGLSSEAKSIQQQYATYWQKQAIDKLDIENMGLMLVFEFVFLLAYGLWLGLLLVYPTVPKATIILAMGFIIMLIIFLSQVSLIL